MSRDVVRMKDQEIFVLRGRKESLESDLINARDKIARLERMLLELSFYALKHVKASHTPTDVNSAWYMAVSVLKRNIETRERYQSKEK